MFLSIIVLKSTTWLLLSISTQEYYLTLCLFQELGVPPDLAYPSVLRVPCDPCLDQYLGVPPDLASVQYSGSTIWPFSTSTWGSHLTLSLIQYSRVPPDLEYPSILGSTNWSLSISTQEYHLALLISTHVYHSTPCLYKSAEEYHLILVCQDSEVPLNLVY